MPLMAPSKVSPPGMSSVSVWSPSVTAALEPHDVFTLCSPCTLASVVRTREPPGAMP